jgi:hypothetical protein
VDEGRNLILWHGPTRALVPPRLRRRRRPWRRHLLCLPRSPHRRLPSRWFLIPCHPSAAEPLAGREPYLVFPIGSKSKQERRKGPVRSFVIGPHFVVATCMCLYGYAGFDENNMDPILHMKFSAQGRGRWVVYHNQLIYFKT